MYDLNGMCSWYQKSGGYTDRWDVYGGGMKIGSFVPGDGSGSLTKQQYISYRGLASKGTWYTVRFGGRKELCVSAFNTLKAGVTGAGAGVMHLPQTAMACLKGATLSSISNTAGGFLRKIGPGGFKMTLSATGYASALGCWVGIWSHLEKFM